MATVPRASGETPSEGAREQRERPRKGRDDEYPGGSERDSFGRLTKAGVEHAFSPQATQAYMPSTCDVSRLAILETITCMPCLCRPSSYKAHSAPFFTSSSESVSFSRSFLTTASSSLSGGGWFQLLRAHKDDCGLTSWSSRYLSGQLSPRVARSGLAYSISSMVCRDQRYTNSSKRDCIRPHVPVRRVSWCQYMPYCSARSAHLFMIIEVESQLRPVQLASLAEIPGLRMRLTVAQNHHRASYIDCRPMNFAASDRCRTDAGWCGCMRSIYRM